MDDSQTRAALERHWSVSAKEEPDVVDDIYHDDVEVEYPQSGERILGKGNLRALRLTYPADLTFKVHRIRGAGDLWITEYVIGYDGKPVHVVSIMEFRSGRVERETRYFADPFEPPQWRTQWVEAGPTLSSPD